MNKTEFWLARDDDKNNKNVFVYGREPKKMMYSYIGKIKGLLNPDVRKLFLPGIRVKNFSVVKIIRTVTDDGKVIFERAK